jgi:RNA polymerase sigma factor (sigma-70 family)
MDPSDGELARQARAGDAEALGLLFTRHRPALYRTALRMLGTVADAEDAVQESALIALTRITSLRDADVAGAWLRGITRNVCRSRLRPPPVIDTSELACLRWNPERVVEQHALRDWVWHALGELTPPLRLVMLLRHFSGLTRYEAIADVCGVPVGTVRSRLSQARSKLSESLLATVHSAHADAGTEFTRRRREAEEVLRAAAQGRFAEALTELYSPAVESFWPGGGHHHGTDHLVRAMDRDLTDGVRRELVDVVGGPDVLIWEERLINPPEDPLHCPPGAIWVQSLVDARVQELRIYHHPR